jgi:hypothetical protein
MKYTWFPLRNYHLFKNIKKIEHAFLPEVRRIAYCFKYTKKKHIDMSGNWCWTGRGSRVMYREENVCMQ